MTGAVRRGEMTTSQLAGRRNPRNRKPVPDDKDAYRHGYGLTSVSAVFEWIPAAGILADCPIPTCRRVNALTASQLRVASR